MITAETLKWGSTLDAITLSALVHGGASKSKDKFTGAKFLGITNGGEFCYMVTFRSEDFEGTDSTKVFVRKDPSGTKVIATIG